MKFHLLILLLSLAKAEGLEEQGDDQYDVRKGDLSEGGVEQDSLPWENLEELAELERKAEYTIKVIILTMNRCALVNQSLTS